jgi:hypothetical protein
MEGGVPFIRSQIEARLRALENEREALEQALAALAEVPAATPKPVVAKRTTRARRGENLEKILPVVAASPGITPREIAAVTGIDPRIVSATLSKLRRDGRLGPAT